MQVGNLARYVRRVAEAEDQADDTALDARLDALEARVAVLEAAP